MTSVEKLKNIVAELITAKIEASELTQKQAADISGMTQPRISFVINNKIEIFTLDKLIDVGEKLGVEFYWEGSDAEGRVLLSAK